MSIIAKHIPTDNDCTAGKIEDVAKSYGLTKYEFKQAMSDYQDNEGFDSAGNEYRTLHDWLTKPHGKFIDNTPYQKGDDLNN